MSGIRHARPEQNPTPTLTPTHTRIGPSYAQSPGARGRDDAEQRPPQGSLKLSAVLRALAKAGHAKVEEISFERRYWEVESRLDGREQELHVDPRMGEIVSNRTDD